MSTNIDIQESSKATKGKAVLVTAPARPGGWKKGIAIMDFILRLGAIAAALGAAASMGMSDQTLPFFTQFFQFEASYDSFTTFQYVTFNTLLLICIFVGIKIFYTVNHRNRYIIKKIEFKYNYLMKFI
jgi:hypothetical protein